MVLASALATTSASSWSYAAMTAADPAGSASSICSPILARTRWRVALPNRPTRTPRPPPMVAPPSRWTLPSASFVTSTTPSPDTVLPSISCMSPSKSCFARSGIRYRAIRTSSWSLSLIAPLLRVRTVSGQRLRRVLVQRPGVLLAQVRVDVEDDLLDLAGEAERRLVLVALVDDETVVAADVHPRVAGEA